MCCFKLLKMLIMFSLTRLIMSYNSANILKTFNDARHCVKKFHLFPGVEILWKDTVSA